MTEDVEKFCRFCGAPIERDQRFCPKCGKAIVRTNPNTTTSPPLTTDTLTNSKNEVAPVGTGASKKILSIVQIFLAFVAVILVLATPFAYFRFTGYAAFAVGNLETQLVAAAVVITVLGIAYTAYMLGWKFLGQKAAVYAKMNLYLGAFQWLWVISLVTGLWSQITYHETFAFNGYSWWLGASSYAVVLGAILFTITGFIAFRMNRVVSLHPTQVFPTHIA